MKKQTTNSPKGDIHDDPKDEKYLKSEKATINLPEVKDIPGQEHVRPPKLGEFVDTTISSDDEEGKGLLDDEDDTDVSPEERELLERTSTSTAGEEDQAWEDARLDDRDTDGTPLNERTGFSGRDLDVPGAEADDEDEELGEEDEENNSYSLGGDRHDD